MIYKRNIQHKIVRLRMAFAILVVSGIICYVNAFTVPIFILILLFVLGAIIVVKGFEITNDHMHIATYYCFGCIVKRNRFYRHREILIQAMGPAFGETDQWNTETDPTDIGAGFGFWFFNKKVVKREFLLRQHVTGAEKISEHISLTRQEAALLTAFMHPRYS